jgi:ubiquinone/menaquinone biosynthesis C-methylase UbiE
MQNAAKAETLKANQLVHSQLVVAGEYQKSPHFRPENKERVRSKILSLTKTMPSKSDRAIDFGCGTGFMIDLMHDQFVEVHGVDITQEMMREVDCSSGNIFLHEAAAEQTPFESSFFDFATAYSFMDHLYDPNDFLKEVYRVLKSEGIFYSGLNPNRAFIQLMDASSQVTQQNLPPVISREIQGALHNGAYYQENFGIDGDTLNKAEPVKSGSKGFDAEEILRAAQQIGFSQCRIEYEWFLGQAKVMHEQSFDLAANIDSYLTSILPASASLYKYLNFIFIK